MKDAEILDAAHLPHLGQNLVGQLLELDQIGADDLDRIRALDPGKRLFHVVLNILREIEADAGKLVLKLLLNNVGELLL